jgi:hypothetical protein
VGAWGVMGVWFPTVPNTSQIPFPGQCVRNLRVYGPRPKPSPTLPTFPHISRLVLIVPGQPRMRRQENEHRARIRAGNSAPRRPPASSAGRRARCPALHPPRPRPPAAPEARSRPAQDRSAGLTDPELAGRRGFPGRLGRGPEALERGRQGQSSPPLGEVCSASGRGMVLFSMNYALNAGQLNGCFKRQQERHTRDNGVCEDVPPRRNHATRGRNRSRKHRAATAPCQSPSAAGPGPSRAAGRARPPARDACLTRGAGLIGQ